MYRITEDPSSGSLVQCLAKNYKNGPIVSVDMGKVGVMAAYYDRVCSSLYMKVLHIHFNLCALFFQTATKLLGQIVIKLFGRNYLMKGSVRLG